MADNARDRAVYLRMRLSQASRRGEVKTIEGVTFDLNHPDLDRGNWQPVDVLGGTPFIGFEPALIYPWTAPRLAKRLNAEGEAATVVAGDRIVIRRVATFDQAKTIVRGDQRLRAPGYWLFVGVGDVMTHIHLNDLSDVRYALIARFEHITGMNNLDDELIGVEEADWNAKFRPFDEETQAAARMLWKVEDFQEHAGMAFGYLIGRAEAREGRRAVSKTASTSKRSTGDPTRQAAVEIIDETPDIIQRRCAERVAEMTDKTVKSVMKTISPLFHLAPDGSSRPYRVAVEMVRLGMRPPSAAKI